MLSSNHMLSINYMFIMTASQLSEDNLRSCVGHPNPTRVIILASLVHLIPVSASTASLLPVAS